MSNKSRGPLAWQAPEDDFDVEYHLITARNIAGSVMAIDGLKDLDSLPEGAVCTLMALLERELNAVESILENHDAQGGES